MMGLQQLVYTITAQNLQTPRLVTQETVQRAIVYPQRESAKLVLILNVRSVHQP